MENPSPNDIGNRDLVFCGDAQEVMSNFPSNSVDCIVTSPPYYGQRTYGAYKEIGDEDSPEEYVRRLKDTFDECNRVLKEEGTLWLNMGDKYIKKELQGMPWRTAIELKKDGWILRSDIIWHKPNAMPSSVKSRPTTDHEYIFLFAKSKDYYYDTDSIREEHVTFTEDSKMRGGRSHFGEKDGTPEEGKYGGSDNLHDGRWDQAFHPEGRNRRTVWEIPLSKFPDAHFAVFPEELVKLCLLAGCPKDGVVLDPFIGSGTTGVVARKLGRKFVGIDSNEEYCKMTKERVGNQIPLGIEN
ncbi:DNA-methyltransferase [Salinibacter ruber]|jgi:site-specific DNA-methyltransferase (adenine-specific)|uniref:DNA-methyltransferase n=1 Tax=Salinibacter ruber TaxID=146919 RepID=UPI002166CB35|nr:site-specific DNA-methyltransferase [Salinibacter ruber]MCS4182170.1 site-specific DNA-methyltransferase (adenine-specific) [Salinibacter ruber]